MQTNKIETMPINKLIFNMSLPMIISLLIQSLYNMVDSMFVAKLSEDALTATSLAFPVQMIMIAVGVGSAVGLNALLSKTLGKKDYHEASMVAMSGIALAIIHSLIFTIIGLLWTERMAMSFTDNVAIAQMCTEYLWICIVFCLGNLVCMTFQRILQASGNTFLSMMVLGSGAVTNIILDPILIFGLNGYFAFGIRGAALATVIGQWVSMIVGLFLCLKKNKDVNLTFQGFTLQIKRIIEIYKVGFPTIVMQSLNGLMVTVINSILLPFSTTAVAFFGVYYKLQNIVFMPINGLGQALIPIVGYNYGAKHKKRILDTIKTSTIAAIIMSLIGTMIFITMSAQLLHLFNASEEMLTLGIPALRIISIPFTFASISILAGYFASGLGDGITNMVCAFIRQFIPLLPCVVYLAQYGIDYIWYAFWISEILGVLFSLIRVKKLIQKKIDFND